MKYKNLLFIGLSVLSLSLNACAKDPGSVDFEVDDIDDINDIHTDYQDELLNAEDVDRFVLDHNDTLGSLEDDKPNSIKLNYSIDNDSGLSANKVTVRISKNQDMSDYMSFSGSESEAELYNFEINTKYYYQVVAQYKSEFKSEIKSFTVNSDAPRNLFVEGVVNCRDLGGWDIGEGRVYKQGLIYRTGQFNYGGKDNTFVSAPSDLGKKVLVEDLKIKTEIDLRKTYELFKDDEVNSITSSPLGGGVKYVSCPMNYGNKSIYDQEKNLDSIRKFFDVLADENNYPIAFHCLRGTDRTGALAYVLGALVGMIFPLRH